MNHTEYERNISVPENAVEDSLQSALNALVPPILIVSSRVGKGNISVGAALERLTRPGAVARHVVVEEILPASAVNEDLSRYKFISSNFPFLLNLVYRFPFIYWRKLFRELHLNWSDLSGLYYEVMDSKCRSLLCISHRPTFWMALAKKRFGFNFPLYGVLTEFGPTPGWRYVPWDAINTFLIPIHDTELGVMPPSSVSCHYIGPICDDRFHSLARSMGERGEVLFAAGAWGQVRARKAGKLIAQLLEKFPGVRVHAVCGTNAVLFAHLCAIKDKAPFGSRLSVYPVLDSLFPLLERCGSVITKPGFSTLCEAFAANRKIFLLRGMPVAEDHNAHYALRNFGADWYTLEDFRKWQQQL